MIKSVILGVCFAALCVQNIQGALPGQGPDVTLLIDTFKGSNGVCTSKINVQYSYNSNYPGANRYQVSLNNYTYSGHLYTNASVYVYGNGPQIHQTNEVKPFRPDYKFYPGLGYYKFSSDKLKWGEARRQCANEGAHLVIINSDSEAQLIGRMITENSRFSIDYEVYAGFHDFFISMEFLTTSGEPLSTTGYLKWARMEPSRSSFSRCGAVDRDGKLKIVSCDFGARYICEKEIEYQPAAIYG